MIEQNSWLEMIKKGHWVAKLQRAVGKISIPYELQSELINYSSKIKEKKVQLLLHILVLVIHVRKERAITNISALSVSL